MATDIPLRCACGKVRGVAHELSADVGNRVVCYCDDCQAFPNHLQHADAVLDEIGGTEIFQTAPTRVELSQGADQLRCLRLTDKGPLRWYAACCGTPIANTAPTVQMPFVGLLHNFMDFDAQGGDRGAVLGPVRGGVYGKFARASGRVAGTADRLSAALAFRMMRRLVVDRLRGLHSPSPFFDSKTGRPRVEPDSLSEAERTRAYSAPDPA